MQNMSGDKTALGLDVNAGSMLCYLNVCLPFGLIYSIIVLVTEKTNKLVRFHAFQSLLLFAATVVVGFALGVVLGIMTAMLDFGFLTTGFQGIFMLASLGLWIFMAVKGYAGEMFKLPVIGDMAEKWSNS